MSQTTARARVAVGSVAMAVAGFSVGAPLAASPASAPPSTEPGSTGPGSSVPIGPAPVLDPEREALVDDLVSSLDSMGLQLDRDCVAGVVAQVPDEDIAILAAEIEDPTVTGDEMIVETSVPGTMPADTMTPDTVPTLSPETEALGEEVITCLVGSADPFLVAEALAAIAADPSAPDFDMACVEAVLSTFSDETLALIIDDEEDTTPSETATDETAGEVSVPEEALREGLMLLVCATDLMDEVAADTATPTTEG